MLTRDESSPAHLVLRFTARCVSITERDVKFSATVLGTFRNRLQLYVSKHGGTLGRNENGRDFELVAMTFAAALMQNSEETDSE